MCCVGLLVLAGCGPSVRTEMFDVFVTNATNGPITISLAKESTGGRPGPYEPAWATPEDIAVETPKNNEKWGLAAIPPGKTASVEKMSGQFDDRSRGMVRAYRGDATISQMLARAADSPDRVDVPLKPGRNEITIVDKDGRLVAESK